MKMGAFDYLQKPIDAAALMDLVEQAIQRDRESRAATLERRKTLTLLDRLSLREREVLRHIVNGKSSSEVANTLGITQGTVEFHRGKVLKVMDVESTIELVRLIYRTDIANLV
jgi:FixJ family two-component response regulator